MCNLSYLSHYYQHTVSGRNHPILDKAAAAESREHRHL